MSIFWSLVNVSKGQQFTIILCVLSLVVPWSCHCSKDDAVTNESPHITTTDPVATNSTNKPNTTMEEEATSVPNNSTEESFTTSKRIQNGDALSGSDGNPAEAEVNVVTSERKFKVQGNKAKSDPPVVLISLLTIGLLATVGTLAAAYHSFKKSRTPPCTRLAEEADAPDHDSVMFPVASQDQSEAPDKPTVNGEAQEKGENTKSAVGGGTGEGQVKKGKEEGDTEL